jgi:hypothetical protein
VRRGSRFVALVIGLVTVTAYASRVEGDMEGPGESDLVALQESLTPLERHFNEHRALHRLLAVLSPT